MKTVTINGREWKTSAKRASYENLAFVAGYDPEEVGLTITYRATVPIQSPGIPDRMGDYSGTLTKGNECVVCDNMRFNVARI